MDFDIIIIGSGPGGYVAAIRASQLGMRTAIVEKSELGGVCLNWGCIPTKALLKSAQVYQYMKHADIYGVKTEGAITPDFNAIVQRSRTVAEGMSKGVGYLIKKNNITVLQGFGKVLPGKKVEVTDNESQTKIYSANHIIIATGSRSKQLPGIEQDGKKIIGYREALSLPKQPESMLVIGSGAIGSEFAYFYNAIGTKVTLVEYMPEIVPLEDIEVSKQLARSFKKAGIKILTSSTVTSVDKSGELCKASIKTSDKEEVIEAEIVLSAAGVSPNIEGIGLEEAGIAMENGKIAVDKYYKTNIEGYYAIGDVIPGPALAHVASHEAIICVESIAGNNLRYLITRTFLLAHIHSRK
jgi:dihydrolipoamide dehydrogenase